MLLLLLLLLFVGVVDELVDTLFELSNEETVKPDFGIVVADILRRCVYVYVCVVVSRFFVLCYHPIITRAASASC